MAKKKPTPPKMGRPSRYRAEYAGQARELCLMGYTDERLADFFGVGIATFYRWRKAHPAFALAAQEGKDVMDARVLSKLAERAMGVTVSKEKVVIVNGKAEIVTIREDVPPDPTSAIFWLVNRQPGMFKKDPKPAEEGAQNAESLAITFSTNEPVREVTVTRGKPKA